MILNSIEKLLMNNPVRAASQRHLEARILLGLGGPVPGGTVLEAGCGRGVGVGIILRLFGAARVDAFDLDPDMVERARRRLAREGGRVRLWTGDAARIEADDGAYDAVFDFGIIHHVPRWRDAVGEAARVLKPGGRLFAEEIFRDLLDGTLARAFTRHPRDDRFGDAEFSAALRAAGLDLVGKRLVGRLGGWYVARRRGASPDRP